MSTVVGVLMGFGGFLDAYKSVFAATTDAPAVYRDITCYAAAGAVLAPRVYLPWGSRKLRPVMWVCLVGPSTVVRKNTSVEIAAVIMQHTGLRFCGDYTRERLVALLAQEKQVHLFAPEIKKFFEAATREYAAGVLETMTEAFDGSVVAVSRETQGSHDTIRDSCVMSVLSATTPEWLAEAVSRHAELASGFFARLLTIYCGQRDKPEEYDRRASTIRERLVASMLMDVPPTELALSQDGARAYAATADFSGMKSKLTYLPSLVDRMPEYLLKLAMLESLNRGDRLVEVCDVEAGRLMLDRIGEGLGEVERLLGQTAFQAKLKQFVAFLMAHDGKVWLGDCYKDFPVKGRRELQEIIAALEESGTILTRLEAGSAGKPAQAIYLGGKV